MRSLIKLSGRVLLVMICLVIIVLRLLLWNSTCGKINFSNPNIPSSIKVMGKESSFSIDNARRQLLAMMNECKIPGLSIAVSKQGSIIWSESFGYSDLDKKIKTQPITLFRVASISKLFCASAMMKLVEKRKLDLHASVREYVPEFPDNKWAITPDLLASHKAGIRSYHNDSEAINTQHYNDVISSLEKFKDDPLLFQPGTGFEYSGYGYVLLSAVIQRASGKSFLSFMKQEVFRPLKMESTFPDGFNNPVCCKATFYDNTTPFSLDGSIVVSPYNDFSCKWAAGGFLSTAEDMVHFGNGHIPGYATSLLKNETLDSLFKPRMRRMGILSYCYGWLSAPDPYLRKVHFNFGAGSGGTAVLIIYPAQKVTLAIAANLGHAKFPYNRLMNIINSFVDKPVLIFYDVLVLLAFVYLFLRLIKLFKKQKNYETDMV